nr:Chain F, AEVVAVKSE peptide [synthetic construct]
AEVVAVKSE